LNKKRSPWFDGGTKPAHVGVYERKYSWGIWYSHWNGKRWGVFDATVRGAQGLRSLCSVRQALPWRGLAKNPNA
jgi:hypothetical protein